MGSPKDITTKAKNLVGIHLDNISFEYENQKLFHKFQLSIPGGQTTAILGPSGIGKSSLLRLLANLNKPIKGAVIASDGNPLIGRIAYMDQRDLLLPWLSVTGNVGLGSKLRGEKINQEKLLEIIESVGLIKYKDLLPQTLSGGMRQRTALARTLVENRPIVLMDEPFGALDTLTRHRLQELSSNLLGDRTVILVTHDPFEALRLAHQIIVLKDCPVSTDPPLKLAGNPPRDPANKWMTEHYSALLHQLRATDKKK